MSTGLVLGKFYPPHAGHHFLIQTAQEDVDDLTVIVVQRTGQKPEGKLRHAWLAAAYPKAKVLLVDDIYNDDNSQMWADYTIKLLGYVPDMVFTSEEYGERWSKLMGSKHVLVDLTRKTFPVCGTAVRSDPLANWQYLRPEVRAYYAKRVCVLGAESTGTTTLAGALAKHYRTTWVPEYGREYTYGKITADKEGATWQSQEFTFIAEQQNAQEDQMARLANKILFCDTNAFATAVWHERYMGSWSKEVEQLFIHRHYDLYIVTDADIPFVQDGIRDGEHLRKDMHKRFIELLEKYQYPFVVVSGDRASRLKQATKYCDELLESDNAKPELTSCAKEFATT